MYTGRGFTRSELGDVDVIVHKGEFHLFHLVLPNHDYIAHAVSKDGFLWRRVQNPLFIGEPGEWDDDMLWTMHVSPDPDGTSAFRMLYTGLSRKESGKVQRIGLARSDDLYSWRKVKDENFPLSIEGPHYEDSIDQGRHWVSCRDPFFYREGDTRLMLVNARVPDGPVIRRGCVGVAQEYEPGKFRWREPLFYPRMYDDIEVPGLFHIGENYYLLGNIREDIKIHYWHSPEIFGVYQAYADNVLLPRGNYASRLTKDDKGWLLWNFFSHDASASRMAILPPPTRLDVQEDGQLFVKSYEGFDKKVSEKVPGETLRPLRMVLNNPSAGINKDDEALHLWSVSGYEIFAFDRRCRDFRFSATLHLEGLGKTGLVFRQDPQGNGHYISLDLINGIAQGRFWSERHDGDIENAFDYNIIQSNRFPGSKQPNLSIELVVFGGYVELSIDRRIVLRYVDIRGMDQDIFGIYVESAKLALSGETLEILDGPEEEDHQLF